MKKAILVGAVAYDPKVVVIWDIIKDFFRTEGCPIDYVFYSGYELQVDALLAGHIDIAWNSPLAWVDAQRRTGGACRAIAMRDTDRDRVTRVVVRADSGIEEPEDLSGKVLATGASDSPQATLLPLFHLSGLGIPVEVSRHDIMVGKHGDHVGGERDAFIAMREGRAAACAVLDLNWDLWSSDGTADPAKFRVLTSTAPFDHCNFTVTKAFPAAMEKKWCSALFKMSYENPEHRSMMDMEGLKVWLPGRLAGYEALALATEEQRFFDSKAE